MMHRPQPGIVHGPSALSAAWVVPNATIFISSAAIMMIELVAGRIISRHLGSSVYTWTSVIGIVLAGIAVGNYVGGLIADRFSSRRTLAILFMCGSAMSVAISMLDRFADDFSPLWTLSWPMRVAGHVALVFFVPTAFLGTISPVIAKMALDLGRERGRTIGDIYAFGVVGSLVGTFLTGYYLIAALGTIGVVCLVACILAVMAVLYDRRLWLSWLWAAAAFVLTVLSTSNAAWANQWGQKLALRWPRDDAVVYQTESNYSAIEVVQFTKSPDFRGMHLDTLLHSQRDMNNLADFRYAYEKVYFAITTRMRPNTDAIDTLHIGGGGYVYPQFASLHWPRGRTEVVEIDPAVTEAAMAAFGLPRDTPIISHHEDGRIFVRRAAENLAAKRSSARYDFVYTDAFNDYNVPYQLTTLEFTRDVERILKPDGAYLLHMIDVYDSGLLVGSLITTLKQVFPHVHVFLEGYPLTNEDGTPNPSIRENRSTFILSGSKVDFDTRELGPVYNAKCTINVLSDGEIRDLEERAHHLVLTDEFAPVENLLEPVVKSSALEKAVDRWNSRATEQIIAGNYDEGIRIAEEAVRIFPNPMQNLFLVETLGSGYEMKENWEEAIAKYHTILRYNPVHQRSHAGLITCYTRLGDYAQTLPHYEFLIRELPEDIGIRFNYAAALSRTEQWAEAKAQLLEVLRRDPGNCDAEVYLGTACFKLNDGRSALAAFRRALTCRPDYALARQNIDQILHLNSAEVEHRIAELMASAATSPADGAIAFEIAEAYYSLRMAAEALDWFDKVVALQPKRVDALIHRADCLVELQRLDEAKAGYRAALKIAPDNAVLPQNIKRIEDYQASHPTTPGPTTAPAP